MAEAAWLDRKDYPFVKYPDAGHFVSEIRPADLSSEIGRL